MSPCSMCNLLLAGWHPWSCVMPVLAQANGRASSPVTTRLHLGHLTRNVTEEHIQEIFSTFGTLKSVELSIDKVLCSCLFEHSAQRSHVGDRWRLPLPVAPAVVEGTT